ncbi:MAG: helix-turn-helix transcriptional regulator [Planctomycetaceae bacterium]
MNLVDRLTHRTGVPLMDEGATRLAATRGRIDEIRSQIETDLPALLAAARRAKAAHDAAIAPVRQAILPLKAEREAQGVSLTDLEARTGVAAAELERIERESQLMPSLVMLDLYARALNKRLWMTLTELN